MNVTLCQNCSALFVTSEERFVIPCSLCKLSTGLQTSQIRILKVSLEAGQE